MSLPWQLKRKLSFWTYQNPLDLSRSPGGSSGGSAAAVAADMCMVALGSDTGGSVRQPAAFTGIIGFKPSYGAISRYGLVAFASSLDQIGILAKPLKMSFLPLLSSLGKTTWTAQPQMFHGLFSQGKRVRRIGLVKEVDISAVDPQVKEGYELFVQQLSRDFDVVEVSIRHWEEALAAYYFIAPAEASSNLARYDGVRYGTMVEEETYWDTVRETRNLLGEEVKRRILLGSFALSAGFKDALYEKAITYVAGLYWNSRKHSRRGPSTYSNHPHSAFQIG